MSSDGSGKKTGQKKKSTEANKEKLKTNDFWSIYEAYFNSSENFLTEHQVESFNYFIKNLIPTVVKQYNPIVIGDDFQSEINDFSRIINIEFGNTYITRPIIHENNGMKSQLIPYSARVRNFSYFSSLAVDINISITWMFGSGFSCVETKHKQLSKVSLGKIPTMLFSQACLFKSRPNMLPEDFGECKYENGGYFIVNGSEKVVVAQERQAENRWYTFTMIPNKLYTLELKTVNKTGFLPAKPYSLRYSDKGIVLVWSIFKSELPVCVLFKALGLVSDKSYCNIIFQNHEKQISTLFEKSVLKMQHITTQKEAIDFLIKNYTITGLPKDMVISQEKKEEIIEKLLNEELFSHLSGGTPQKCVYLGFLIRKLLLFIIDKDENTDRDSYKDKRVDTVGYLLGTLFRQHFTKMIKDLRNGIIKELSQQQPKTAEEFLNIMNATNVYKLVRGATIENGLKFSLATGNWGPKNTSSKVGVAQVLSRLSYLATLSNLRRLCVPIDKTTKMIKPRKLHASSFGYICSSETPEGGSIGIVKNLAMSSTVTIWQDPSNIPTYLLEAGVTEISSYEFIFDKCLVFVNGSLFGYTDQMQEVVDKMRSLRRQGSLHIHTSIVPYYDKKEIRMFTDSGRLVRPLLIVKNGELVLSMKYIYLLRDNRIRWNDLLFGHYCSDFELEPCVEFIDAEEAETCLIAHHASVLEGNYLLRYTHCEIHPSLILGAVACNIPFSNHNQSPRNTYQCLDLETPVLMAGGYHKAIKNIKVGEEVVTFDPKTMKTSNSKIINQYVRETDKPMFEVATISDRKIKATFDHKFMTSEGWKKVEEMKEGDLIGIHIYQEYASIEVDKYLILDSEMVRETMKKEKELKSLNSNIKSLEKLGLLPLYSDHPKLPIIARMFGFVLTDGSVGLYTKGCVCQVDFGSTNAAAEFEDDVAALGLNKVKITEGTREFRNSTFHTFNVNHSGILGVLMISLGMTHGKRSMTAMKPMPEWILKGSMMVKREFLGGLFGGDGCKIRFNKVKNGGHNFISAALFNTKHLDYEESLTLFMENVGGILNEFDIRTLDIKKVIAKYDKNKIQVGVKLCDSQDNLLNFFDKIGYRYDERKQMESASICEYIKYKRSEKNRYNNIKNKIISLKSDGKSVLEISNILSIKQNTVRDQLKNPLVTNSSPKYNISPDKFINKLIIKEKCLFVPIKSITSIPITTISDITTESDNHSFIASGVMTHNSAMGKQAIGIYATNFASRIDTMSNILYYPMKQLVSPKLAQFTNSRKMPSGQMVIVGIMSSSGFNQEDAMLVNKSAIERGLFRSSFNRCYQVEERKTQLSGEEEKIMKPSMHNTLGMKHGSYANLKENGLPIVGSKVNGGDIIIGKVIPRKFANSAMTEEKPYKDSSMTVRNSEQGYVSSVFESTNSDGYRFCKVILRNPRIPQIGDKFSATHGQKGTIGMVYSQEDMPVNEDGISPDIIINPHAIPSRMTCAMLLEVIMGHLCCHMGMEGDGTPFNNVTIEGLSKMLEEHGLNPHGEQTLYNGKTGKKLNVSIFMGPCYYQRLKHMVDDKSHSRAEGPVVMLTRQPSEGRSRHGGFRLGEMERDCLVSHGLAQFLKCRFMDNSDNWKMHISRSCGLICGVNEKDNMIVTFDDKYEYDEVRTPYCMKLLIQELSSMGIYPKIIVNK